MNITEKNLYLFLDEFVYNLSDDSIYFFLKMVGLGRTNLHRKEDVIVLDPVDHEFNIACGPSFVKIRDFNNEGIDRLCVAPTLSNVLWIITEMFDIDFDLDIGLSFTTMNEICDFPPKTIHRGDAS